MYSYTAPQANGDSPGMGGALSADDFSEPTANGTYQSMATGVHNKVTVVVLIFIHVEPTH